MAGIERRLERLEGRAAIGRGSVAVGWEGDDGLIRYGERLLTQDEFLGLRASSHVIITKRKEGVQNG
jgi:hypothetical protein